MHVAVLAVLLACTVAFPACKTTATNKGPESQAHLQWSERTPAPVSSLPQSDRPFLIPGEQMLWRVSIFGVAIGEFAIVVGQPGTIEGHRAAVVKSHIRSIAAGSAIKDVHQEVTTIIELATGRPNYHRREHLLGSPRSWVEVRFTADHFDVTYRDRSSQENTQARQSLPPGQAAFDRNSMLLWLRGWDPDSGQRLSAYVLAETRAWLTQVAFIGREPIAGVLGERSALRFDGVSRRLTRSLDIDPKVEPRHYSIWLSDDAERIPLLLIGRTDYGNIRMELAEYSSGSQ